MRRVASAAAGTDAETLISALAKAVCDGDMVNLRFLFGPFSPARASSSQDFDMRRYDYLLPSEEMTADSRFAEARAEVKRPEIQAHAQKELSEDRPAQLPAPLVLMLADNAVRLGKYTSAAQAYELLRIRGRMQEEFLKQADACLDANDVPRAVRGYLIATGLAYDYSAYPEPLPNVPNFSTRALMLHAEYPDRPEKCVAFQDTDKFVQTALDYLLLDSKVAARLAERPLEQRLAFLVELVRRCDPAWDAFAEQYAAAVALAEEFGSRVADAQGNQGLAQEIEEVLGDDPRHIPQLLLGRVIQDGEWWQYLKELAYEHPPAALFVARQIVGDHEILLPRCRRDLPAIEPLGLTVGSVQIEQAQEA